MNWILEHTHLPGLDTVQTIGAAAAMWLGVVIGKQIVALLGRALGVLQSAANNKK